VQEAYEYQYQYTTLEEDLATDAIIGSEDKCARIGYCQCPSKLGLQTFNRRRQSLMVWSVKLAVSLSEVD
jgi:hypothetical protein